jgi:hypothetical protein
VLHSAVSLAKRGLPEAAEARNTEACLLMVGSSHSLWIAEYLETAGYFVDSPTESDWRAGRVAADKMAAIVRHKLSTLPA